MKKTKVLRSLLAWIIVVASLMGMLPTVFAAEAGDRQQVTVDMADPDVTTEGLSEEEAAAAYEQAILDQLYEQYDFVPEETEDPEFGTPTDIDPEAKPATKDDSISTTYVFLDLKPGQSSRNFNWQVKSDSTKDQYFSTNIQGCLAGYFQGSDARLYMPVELGEDYINGRLNQYQLKAGDIARVRVQSITENDTFVSGGTGTVKSYFAVHTDTTGKDPGTWQSFGTNQNLTTKSGEQTLTWTVSSGLVGQKIRGVRWDPSQSEIPETRIYIDYIYIGPAAYAPVKVEYRNEANSSNLGYHYVGFGKKANGFSTGQTNTEDSTTQTIWGWQVHEYRDGAWVDMEKFLTDPSTYTCKRDTRFVLKKVTIRKETPNSTQEYDNGYSTDDDKYTLTVDAFNTAEMDLGNMGTPLDIAILLDRSGSQAELVTNNKCTTAAQVTTKLENLSKTVEPGYYRATCFRQNKSDGSSGSAGYVYTMPMRYYRGEWQMQCLVKCTCDSGSANSSSFHSSYGIYRWNSTGMNPCSHVKWVSMTDGFNYFKTYASNTGYTVGGSLPFNFGVSRLGRAQSALATFCAKLYNSTYNLPAGKNHTVSVIGYGDTIFANKYPFHDGNNKYVTTGGMNYSACTKASAAVNGSNYEAILKAIRDPYVFGATRTDFAFQALAGKISDFESKAGVSSTLAKTDFLPAATSARKRVVILMTDGVPCSSMAFDSSVATKAIAASKILKSASNTTVYALAALDNLDDTKYYTSSYTSGTDVQKANNFMNLVSSRYPAATAYNTPGSTQNKGPYYIADTSAGSELSANLTTVWDAVFPALTTSNKTGPGSLWLYEDFGREWKPDASQTVRIYGEAYTGNGSYSGTRVLIGEHKVTDNTVDQTFIGNGYKLHYYYDSSDQSFAYALQWTDAKTAFLRETALSTGSKAKVLTRAALDVSKGYKIYMEMPVEVDRNNTLGGNNIPLTTSQSGCYQAKDETDTEMGSRLYSYERPNANVYCSVGTEAHDYFISMEDYMRLLDNNRGAVGLASVLGKMVRLPENLKVTNDFGLSNLNYVSFDVTLQDSGGRILYRKAADLGANAFRVDVYLLDEDTVDLSCDHRFTLTAKMTNVNHMVDSFGIKPFADVWETFYPTYYVPKFAVADFGGTIEIPMMLEGADPSRISQLSHGNVFVGDGYLYVNRDYEIMREVETYSYVYHTENIPMGAQSNDIEREVYLIPANVVSYNAHVFSTGQYEDGGLLCSLSQRNSWQFEGRFDWAYGSDLSKVHGYEPNSLNMRISDMISLRATIDNTGSAPEGAQMSFSFTGTGFELLGEKSPNAPLVLVEIYRGKEAVREALVEAILCDAYSSEEIISGAPLVRWMGDHGEYTVLVTGFCDPNFLTFEQSCTDQTIRLAYYLGIYDFELVTLVPSAEIRRDEMWHLSTYELCVNGVRILHTVEEDPLVTFAYRFAGEENAEFIPLSDLVLSEEEWSQEGRKEGILLAGPSGETTVPYNANEIILNRYEGVAFAVEESLDDKLQLSLRAVGSEPVTVSVWNDEAKMWVPLATLTTDIPMFYDVSRYSSCLMLRVEEGTMALGMAKVFCEDIQPMIYVDDSITNLVMSNIGRPMEREESGYEYRTYNGDGYTLYLDPLTGKIVKCTMYHDDITVVIPYEIDGIPVVGIASCAFDGCNYYYSLDINGDILEIGAYAFAGNYGLTEVYISSCCLQTIGERAFADCQNLTTVYLRDCIADIGESAFSGCDDLTAVYYEGSLSQWQSIRIHEVGNERLWYADIYYWCYALAFEAWGGYVYYDPNSGEIIACDPEVNYVEIPEEINGVTITSIGEYAFDGCNELDFVYISEGVTSIGAGAFNNCSRLSYVVMPATMMVVGEGAFGGCSSMSTVEYRGTKAMWYGIRQEIFNEPLRNATVIYDGSPCEIDGGMLYFDPFTGYLTGADTRMTEATIPEEIDGIRVIGIEDYTFAECSYLTSATIPEGVTFIGRYGFGACYEMVSVTIPVSVTYIGDYAFFYCNSLTDVYYGGTEAMWNEIQIDAFNEQLQNATIHFLGEPEEPAAPEVVQTLKPGHSLNLQSNISINYMVSSATLAGYDSYEIKCYIGDKPAQVKVEEKDGYVYFILTDINALQMNEMVRAEVYAYKDGKTYVSPLDEYSIVTYATNMMSRAAVPQQVKRMCAALLRYGAASQIYMNYNVDNLADSALTEEQRGWLSDLETVEFDNRYAVLEDVADPQVTWYGKTLVLNSTVALKFAIDASGYEGDPAELELRVRYTDIDGKEQVLTAKATPNGSASKYWLFVIDSLNAADLRAELHCQVYAGETAVSQTMVYSGDSYCIGKTGALLELCKALFAYVDEARAFFGG